MKSRRLRLNSLALKKLRQDWQEDRFRISRRSLVVGAGAAIAAPAAAKATAGVSSFSGFKISRVKNRAGGLQAVHVSLANGNSWVLDTTHFEGAPRLTMSKLGTTTLILLEGARMPGSRFNVNLRAEIQPKLASHSIRLQFTNAGVEPLAFSMQGNLEGWLSGSQKLSVKLSKQDLAKLFGPQDLTDHLSVQVLAAGVLSFLPSNKWSCTADAVITSPDGQFPVAGLILGAESRTPNTIVGGASSAATVLTGVKRGSWNDRVALVGDAGWRLEGSTSGFDSYFSESHESGDTAVVLTGQGGLSANLGDELKVPLEESQLARLYGRSSDVIFSGKPSQEGAWIHHPGLSVNVRPREGSTFILRSDRSGSLVGAPEMEAVQVAPLIEDAIVTVRSESESFPITLQAGTTAVKRPGLDQTLNKLAPIPPGLISAHPVSVYLTFFASLEVVRPADMLNLTFEMVNLSITSSGAGASAQVANADSPAHIVVTFPPQSLAEDTFKEVSVPSKGFEPLPVSASPWKPIKTRLANPTRLSFEIPRATQINMSLEGPGGLLDWSKWNPAVAPTAIFSYAPKWNIVIDPNWTHPITFANAPSDMTSVIKASVPRSRFSFSKISLKPPPDAAVVPVLRPVAKNTNTTRIVAMIPTGRVPVHRYQTWIEMPAWLALSPPENSAWIHSPAPDPTSPSVLWNTRLAYGTDKGPVWASDDGKWFYVPSDKGFSGPFSSPVELHPTVRAVDAFDYAPRHDDSKDWFDLASISPSQRSSIVDGMTPRSATESKDTPAFDVENLSLTALGGFLKGDWNSPNAAVTQGVIGWKHIATLGRDHYVRITERGFIYPFGHKAVLVQLSERKFDRDAATGAVYAVMRQRMFIMVTQPTVAYSSDVSRTLGFQQITCLTKTTANLDSNPKNAHNDPNTPNIFWMTSNGAPVLLTLRGVDMENNPVTWEQECGFVDFKSGLTQSAQGQALALGDPPGGPSNLGGHLLSFAPVDPSKPSDPDPKKNHPQTTHFPCLSIVFNGTAGETNGRSVPCFRPILKLATIRVSAVESMQTGSGNSSAGPVNVRYADVFAKNGFGAGNPSETFFEIIQKVAAKFQNLKTSGGLVNPDMPMGALSRKLGPLPTLPDLNSQIPISAYIGGAGGALDAKILGAVSIWDIIPSNLDVAGDGKNIPKITLSKVFSTAPSSGSDSSLSSLAGDVSSILGANAPKIPGHKDVIGVMVQLKWSPDLHDWKPFGNESLFVAQNVDTIFKGDVTNDYAGEKPDKNASFNVDAFFQVIVAKGGDKDPDPGAHYGITAELKWFRVNAIAGIFSVIFVDVQRIGFYVKSGENPVVKVDIPAITFTGCLSFVQTLENWLGGGSNAVHFPSKDDSSGGSGSGSLLASTDAYLLDDGGPGFTPIMQVSDGAIEVGGTLTIPNIDVGYFSLSNISFTGAINLPFLGPSFTITFSFCTKDKPFLLSVDGIAGGGFFAISLAPSGLQEIQAALEFGASISIDLGVASGGVSIMAGVYYDYQAVSNKTTLTGYVRLQGNLTIIEIVSMSLEFYLSLSYTNDNGANSITGTASMTVEVSILFFSMGVTVSVTKTFPGPSTGGHSHSFGSPDSDALFALSDGALPPPPLAAAPFTQGMSQDQWAYYCASFEAIN